MKYLIWPILILLILLRYLVIHPVYREGDHVRITGPVLQDPIKYPTSQYIKLARLKVYLPLFPEIYYGDKVMVEGYVKNGKLDKPKLINILPKKIFLSEFRNSLIAFYQSVLPEPVAGLLSGILLGAKGAIDNDFYNQTKNTGLTHVIVASGTNISFVVSFLTSVLILFFPRKKTIYIVILGILLYLFIAGFDPPLIRAAIMSGSLLLGQESGRLSSTWRIYFLTVLGMLLYNPTWLSDIGFILSFVATAGLLLFEKRIRTKLKNLPGFFREGFSTSLAAQIGVAPILFVTFGQFNILSPLINALVLWTIPFIMIIGAIGGVTGLLLPFLGKTIVYLAYPFLLYFVQIVDLFG